MADPALMPLGVSVDVVDWLPSGARSGLVRVRGRRPHGPDWALPALVLTPRGQGAEERFASLPDPRADRDPGGWRGAYVVEAALAAGAARWELEWPGGGRSALSPPAVDGPAPAKGAEPVAEAEQDAGGEVVDQTVLAERRARRAEAAEQAQARIAKEALRAVEVLELRAGEVEEALARAEAERDALRARVGAADVAGAAPPSGLAAADAAPPSGAPAAGAAPQSDPAGALAAAPPDLAPDAVAALDAELRALRAELARRDRDRERDLAEPPPAADAERRAARLREALTATVGTVAELRLQLHEAQVARRTRELEWSAGAVRLSVLEREHGELQTALAAARADLGDARRSAADAQTAAEAARALAADAVAAHEDARAALAEREEELAAARERIAALEAEVDDVRTRSERAAQEAAEAARIVALAEGLMRAQEQEEAWAARLAGAEAATAHAEGRLAHLEASLDEVETARELAEARAAAAVAARQAAEVAFAAARTGAGEPTGRFARTPPVPAAAAEDRFAAAAERLRQAGSAAPEPSDSAAAPPAAPAPHPLDAALAGDAPPAEGDPATPAADPGPAAGAPAAPAAAAAPVFGAPVAPAFPGVPVGPATPPPVPDDVIAAAAEQVRAAAARASAVDPAERDRVVADLAVAAEALRARVADPDPPSPEKARADDGSPPSLAEALAALAREDPGAAARLLTGLLPAAHLLVDGDLDADVTLTPAGTVAVTAAGGVTAVRPLDRPRPRREAAAHLRTDAAALVRLLAGEDVRVRRFTGPLRLTGPGRRAVHLDRLRGPQAPTLADALRAGAEPEPALALRLLALTVPAGWTRGHDFTLAVHGPGSAARIVVRDGRAPAWDADATRADTRLTLAPGALAGPAAGWTVAGDPAPAAVLRAWIDRLLAPRD